MKLPIPAATTFAEGQRFLYGLLAAGAGMFCGGGAIGMIALLMWGGWSAKEEHTIVVIFGWALGGFILAMVAVIIGLLTGGPVGRFKVNATTSGVGMETDAPAATAAAVGAAAGAGAAAAISAAAQPPASN